MKSKALTSFFIVLLIFSLTYIFTKTSVLAESLTDNVTQQLENLDLSKLENFVVSLDSGQGVSIKEIIYSMVKGEFNGEYSSFSAYIINIISINLKQLLPSLLIIVAISVFCAIIQNAKSSFASEGVSSVIYFISFLTVILIISPSVINIFDKVRNSIRNIANLNEIMSPIILTLMIASGGNASVSIYKPTVQFFSNAVINVMLFAVLPLIGLSLIFSIISQLNSNIKLNKFTDFFNGLIKWIIGITISCYGIFVSIQGISSAIHDGISIKAAKYAISNSIPLIGGFLKDGFDLFVAGSILIKNAVGVGSVIVLIYYVLSPILYILVFSLLLKLVAAVTQTISDSKISDLCTLVSKSLVYVNVTIILTGFMMFVTILLMIFSANAFI